MAIGARGRLAHTLHFAGRSIDTRPDDFPEGWPIELHKVIWRKKWPWPFEGMRGTLDN
jgi:hypothetical protein